VCMDESCKQMIGEVREPIPCAPVQPARTDDEYGLPLGNAAEYYKTLVTKKVDRHDHIMT
jgi:hypothetical protein